MTTTPLPPPSHDITPVTIEDEMRASYLDYAMSVIVSRALPDVRDGLKPVHRRIVYAMHENGYDYNRPYRKSARIVGDVMGKYHPHGDSAIYDAMVRMAQSFSMRLPLMDGQGNFGSMDGDRAAAMRYTEARLARSAHALIADIDKETVDFTPNYDESEHEPAVLPAQYPNILVNGGGGIAVGMATNIPPHNLGEVIDACCAYIDDSAISIERLVDEFVPGPDFPTGGIILGRTGMRQALLTGHGSVVIRGRATIEEIRKDRMAIVVTEVPYQVNKARMVEIIAEHAREKKIEGIADLRDESDRNGVRVVIEIRRDAVAEIVLNQLYRYTPLQVSFGVNMLALNGGQPMMMNLKDIIVAFIDFREEVIRRRTIHLLGKARDRAHVLAGLAVAVANLDEAIEMIRGAKDAAEAREKLMARAWPAKDVVPLIELIDEPGRGVVEGTYQLSEIQARAILDLRLHRLTGLERDQIANDLREIGVEIEEYLAILSSRDKLFTLLRDELLAMKEQFNNPRRTVIEEQEFEHDIENLIQLEDMVVTVSNTGYMKRVPLSTYRAQRRGGKGRTGMSMRDDDFVSRIFVANTHTPVLFFSSTGMVYKLKVYRLPLGSPQARGKAMINLLPLSDGETISTLMPLPEDEESWGDLFVMFATASGTIRRNRLSDFVNIMTNGKIAMKLKPKDALIGVAVCNENQDVLLAAAGGKCIRFPVTAVRTFTGRASTGVRGIQLAKGDTVITMSILSHVDFATEERDAYLRIAAARRRQELSENGENGEGAGAEASAVIRLSAERIAELAENEEFILTMTLNGFGKRSSAYEYRIAGRGGQGIANIYTSDRNGAVVGSFPVGAGDQIMMVSDGGQLIRCPVKDIRIAGRTTQGVTLFSLAKNEHMVSVIRLEEDEGEDVDVENDGAEESGVFGAEGAGKIDGTSSAIAERDPISDETVDASLEDRPEDSTENSKDS